MEDVTLTYGSTGFEKTQKELVTLKDYAGNINIWFQPANRTLEEHATQGTNAFRKINSAIQDTSSNVLGFIGHIARLGAVVGTVQGILGGLGVYAFERWTKSVLMATDSQKQLEASLLGVVRSQGAVNKIMEFAKGYAETSPMATRHEVLESMRELAFLPSIKPIMEEGDVGMMKRLMDVVQGLTNIRPEAGWAGATSALKLAMMGIWRTMGHEYAIRPEMLAGGAGMSLEEFESSPAKSFKALETHVLAVTQPTTSLTAVINKLRSSYREWLDDLGKTGIFDKVLGYLTQLNQFFKRIGESEQWKGVTRGINAALEGIADGIKKILTKGIDWEKVTDLSGALSAFKKVGVNTIEELGKTWNENKGWLMSTLEKILSFTATSMVTVAEKLFRPVGKAIAEAMKKGAEEHPFWSAFAGAAVGYKVAGVPGAVAGAAAPFVPTLIEAAKDLDFRGAIFGEEAKPLSFKAKEWEGPRPWQVPFAGWTSEALAAMYGGGGGGIGTKKEAISPPIGASQQFAILGSWYKMAGQLSEMEGTGLTKRPGFLFATNQIPAEEYFKRERMGGVQDKYLKQLEEIEKMPEATQIKPQIYQEMFGIAVQRGETTKAGDLLQKTMDAMKKAIEDKAGTSQDIRNTSNNTAEAVRFLRVIAEKDNKDKKDQPVTTPGQAPEGHPVGAGAEQPWSEDELQRQVRRSQWIYEY